LLHFWALRQIKRDHEGLDVVEFGVTEYTLVFRRSLRQRGGGNARALWTVARPITALGEGNGSARPDVAQVFVVPIVSTLAMSHEEYEQFLLRSGALTRALRILNRLTFAQPQTAENARKQIQSIVMAAEVTHIVRRLSA
jgi:hypothetical protein